MASKLIHVTAQKPDRATEIFLRFTHRYWYHEVTDRGQLRDVFHMWTRHLGSERLYKEVRDELHDMSTYLDSDMLRRQANTMVRLTVVTILGLVGVTVTGFFGMTCWRGPGSHCSIGCSFSSQS